MKLKIYLLSFLRCLHYIAINFVLPQQKLERMMAQRFPNNVPVRPPPRQIGGPSKSYDRDEDGFGEAEKFSKHQRYHEPFPLSQGYKSVRMQKL